MWSAEGAVQAWNIVSPKYGDVSVGFLYGIVLGNQTAADIASGTITVECAHALPDDACKPDTWGPLPAVLSCDAAPGTVGGNATITLSAAHPIPANAQCVYSFPCPCQFVRVSGVPAGLDAMLVVTLLRRTVAPSYGVHPNDLCQEVPVA